MTNNITRPTSYSLTEEHRRMIAIIRAIAPGCESDSAALRWLIDETFSDIIEKLDHLHKGKGVS